MTTRLRTLNTNSLGLLLAVALLLGPSASAAADTTEQLDTGCAPGVQPSFVAGSPFAALKAKLGDTMGAAVSCVLTDPSGSGDSVQFTDTGLAVYHQAIGATIFTNGDRHWALAGGQFVQWDNGPIQVQAIPPQAMPGVVPIPAPQAPYCGVDLVTDVQVRGGVGDSMQSNTTQMGVAGKCFDQYFEQCSPAIMTTDAGFVAYRDQIDGPADDGRCRVISSFVANPKADLLGKQMTCDLDNSGSIFDAAQDLSRCSGPLYDALYAGQ